MDFFIPNAKNNKETQGLYEAIKVFLTKELGANFSSRKVRSLGFMHDGNSHTAVVGEPTSANGEVVIAILYEMSRDLYHVCTPNRGVFRGGSLLVGGDAVRDVEDFDTDK